MFGFNWVDAIIILLLIVTVALSVKTGFLTQVCTLGGLFVTLFLAGWLFPHLLPIHDPTLRTIINANLVLLTAAYVAIRGYNFGQNIHWSFRIGKRQGERVWETLETVFGALPGIAAYLVLVWLVTTTVGRLPFTGLSNSVNDARIVQALARALPPVPAVLAEFGHQIDPNSQPYVFAQPQPTNSFAYSAAEVQSAAAKARPSIVRVTSFGCGGIAAGSGFVAAPDLVVTNAHVIAGVKRPIIKYDNGSYEGVPVFFDTGLDLAILRVQNLRGKPLVLTRESVAIDTSVAVLGYPAGNYRVAPGLIRNELNVAGRNIYDFGVIERDVYEVQTRIEHGSSGGPVVLSDGRVAGVIFSKSGVLPDYAYALASPRIIEGLDKAEKSYRRVSTGVCVAD